jgi:hypothetical protein
LLSGYQSAVMRAEGDSPRLGLANPQLGELTPPGKASRASRRTAPSEPRQHDQHASEQREDKGS